MEGVVGQVNSASGPISCKDKRKELSLPLDYSLLVSRALCCVRIAGDSLVSVQGALQFSRLIATAVLIVAMTGR
jgi:hypothetical protein